MRVKWILIERNKSFSKNTTKIRCLGGCATTSVYKVISILATAEKDRGKFQIIYKVRDLDIILTRQGFGEDTYAVVLGS